MKKLLYMFLSCAVLTTACEPNEEIYEELDKGLNAAPVADVEYTLGEDDYALFKGTADSLVFQTNSFASIDDAKRLVPGVLVRNYPQLGAGSSALVNFNLGIGNSETVIPFITAETYALEEADYALAGEETREAKFFNNDVTAQANIPAVLAGKIEAPADGELIAVSHEYAALAYADIKGAVLLNEQFPDEAAFSQLTTQSVVGDQVWGWDDYNTDTFAKMTGYASGARHPNEDWLVLGPVDLANYQGGALKISQAINYVGNGIIGEDYAVKVSTDYVDDVTTATWVDLDLGNQWPEGMSWDFFDAEVDLSAYEKEEIYIAFFYRSTATDAGTWEIASVSVEAGETVETETVNEFYSYSADEMVWAPYEGNVNLLSPADYDAMGAPGRYNNFSKSAFPDDYLHAYLAAKYPYAQEEDEQVVIYKYYAGSTQTRGDVYTYLNGSWVKNSTSIQFGFEKGAWVPDNTIKYTLTSADYALVGNGKYSNFDVRPGKAEEDEAVRLEKINTILKENFPNASEGQKYLVSFNIYNGAAGVWEMHVILKDGEYVIVE